MPQVFLLCYLYFGIIFILELINKTLSIEYEREESYGPMSHQVSCRVCAEQTEEQVLSNPLKFVAFFLFVSFGLVFFLSFFFQDKANFTPLLLLPFPQQHSLMGRVKSRVDVCVVGLCCGRACTVTPLWPRPGTLLYLWDGCAEGPVVMAKASPEVILSQSLMSSEFAWVAASKQWVRWCSLLIS